VAHEIRTTRSPGLLLDALGDKCVARVHGACVGAGIELPAFCRRVEAAADATFQLPEVAMGLIPGAGGTASIPRRIGRQRTAYLAVSGKTIDARTAHRIGLVDSVHE
jgi:enoyl-CoA hydratase/carnithine racemase